MKTLDMNGVVKKLNHILGQRFGVSVQYISISDTPKIHTYTLETVKRNSGAPMIVGHNQLIIPLRIEGALIGAIRVGEINYLNPKELSEVKQTIDLVIGEELGRLAQSPETLFNVLPFERRAHA
jgi:hypothetical protein